MSLNSLKSSLLQAKQIDDTLQKERSKNSPVLSFEIKYLYRAMCMPSKC